jgi:hypothetical protein
MSIITLIWVYRDTCVITRISVGLQCQKHSILFFRHMLIKSVKTLHELVIKHWSYKSLAWGVAYATVFMKWEQEVPFKKADS